MRVRMYCVKDGSTIGYIWDDNGEPEGDDQADVLLGSEYTAPEERRRRFDFYARGYSNGYWATERVD